MYDVKYNDLTDYIPQNINQSIQQHGYTIGLGIGYSKLGRVPKPYSV